MAKMETSSAYIAVYTSAKLAEFDSLFVFSSLVGSFLCLPNISGMLSKPLKKKEVVQAQNPVEIIDTFYGCLILPLKRTRTWWFSRNEDNHSMYLLFSPFTIRKFRSLCRHTAL